MANREAAPPLDAFNHCPNKTLRTLENVDTSPREQEVVCAQFPFGSRDIVTGDSVYMAIDSFRERVARRLGCATCRFNTQPMGQTNMQPARHDGAIEAETTQVTDYIGKPDNAYALLAFLSDKTRGIVGNLLKTLKDEIGEGLWAVPEKTLHITLCEIIQPKPYGQDKQSIYEADKGAYENAPTRILKEVKPIKIHFNKIVVSPQAITIQGEDDGSFNRIRRQLVDILPIPHETRPPPDIVHGSIARFTQELDLERVGQITTRHLINCVEVVKEFRLINHLTLPLLRYETIRTYPLTE